jgi:ribosomal protein S3
LDKVIKTMPDIKKTFKACRVVIAGKLRGGTARTGSFSSGYGVFPRQSLTDDIKMEFGDIRSKYGSFGVKVLT